jgi:hypothetical protein
VADPFTIAALAGSAVSGIAGVLGQNKANDERKKQIARLMRIHDQLQAERKRSSAEARQQLQLGLRDVRGGFDRAAGATRDVFRSAQIDAQDQRQQVMAEIERDLISSGRWSTDALQWARMGVGAQSSRVMAEISARSADALSQIEQRKGLALQGARASLAQQSMMDYRNLSDVEMSRMEVLGADVPGTEDYSQPIGALFGAIGALWPESKAAKAGFDPSGLPYTPSSGLRAGGGPSLPGPSGPPTVSQGSMTSSPLAPVSSALGSKSPTNPWQLRPWKDQSGWGSVNTNAWKSALSGGR